MKTKANVYLLSTDQKSNIILSGFNTLFLSPPMQVKSSDTYQHFYITLPQSDLEISKIKEGDWCLGMDGVFQHNGNITNIEMCLP